MAVPSFDQFRASAKVLPDLRSSVEGFYRSEEPDPVPGILYDGGVYIEGEPGSYSLLIGNHEEVSDTASDFEPSLEARQEVERPRGKRVRRSVIGAATPGDPR